MSGFTPTPQNKFSFGLWRAGWTVADIRAERIEVDSLAATGMAFEYLDHLAMEHLVGVR